MADFGSPTSNLPGIDDVLRATSASSTPAPAQPGFLGSALKTGWYGGLSNLANAGRAVSTAVGAPDLGQSMGDWATQQQANAAASARPDIDALPFWHPEKLAYQAVQSLPMLAAMTGGTALATAGLAGPDELIAGGAGAAALSAAARTAALRGAAGAGAAAYPFMVGQNVEAGDQAGQTLDQGAAGKALALGVPEAALQGILPSMGEGWLAQRLPSMVPKAFKKTVTDAAGNTTTQEVKTGLLGKAAKGAAVGAAIQAPVQAATAGLMSAMGDPNRTFAQRSQDMLDAALGGAAQGALFGGLTHVFAKADPAHLTNENMSSTVDQAVTPQLPAPPPTLALPRPGEVGPAALEPPQRFPQTPDDLGTPPDVATTPVQPGQAIRGLPAPALEPASRPVAGQPIYQGQVHTGEPVDTTPKQLEAPFQQEGVRPGSAETLYMGAPIERVTPEPEPGRLLTGPNDTRPVAGDVITPEAPVSGPAHPAVAALEPPRIMMPDETTEAYKDRLRPLDNATLLQHAQAAGLDTKSGRAALEVMAERLKWEKNKFTAPTADDIRDQMAQQDAERKAQQDAQDAANAKVTAAAEHVQKIKSATKGSIPSYLRPLLGDDLAVKSAIYDRLQAADKPSNTLQNLAKSFDIMDEKGNTTDPRTVAQGTTNLGPETEAAPEQANPVPPPKPAVMPTAIPEQHQPKWQALQDIKSNLQPDDPLNDKISMLQDKLANPKQGEVGQVVSQTNKIKKIIEAQKVIDKAEGKAKPAPTTEAKPPVDEATGAKKFDTPAEPPPAAPAPETPPQPSKSGPQGEPNARDKYLADNAQRAQEMGASDAAQRAAADFATRGKKPLGGEVPPAKEAKPTRPSNEQGPQAKEAAPKPTVSSEGKAQVLGALQKMRANIGELIERKLPRVKGENDTQFEKRNTVFQQAIDKVDAATAAVGKALKSQDPHAALSALKETHLADSIDLRQKYSGLVDDRTRKLLEFNNNHAEAVMDAVREATGQNKADPLSVGSAKPQTQMDRDLAYLVDRGATPRQLLEHIIRNGTTSARRTIAAKLLQTSKADPSIRFGTQAEAVKAHPNLAQVFADYHDGYGRIRVFDKADMEHSIIHEFTHAATLKGLKDPAIAGQFDKLLKAAKEQISPDEAKQYGFTNTKEMVAEAMSNPHFAAFLDTLKPPKDMQGTLPGASIWRAFKEVVRRIFGFPKGAETMLDHVMHLAGQTIDETNGDLTRKVGTAQGMDQTTGYYARGLIEDGERVMDAVDRHLNPKGWGDNVQKALLGGRTIESIADSMYKLVPSMLRYKAMADTHRVIEDRFNSLAKVSKAAFDALPKDVQKLANEIMKFTNIKVDPRRSWAEHTWLQNHPDTAAMKAEVARANQMWNELKRKGGDKAFSAMNNTNRTHLFAFFTGALRNEVLANHAGEFHLGADPFKAYQFADRLHNDPRAAADFWQKQVEAHLGPIRSMLSKQKALLKEAVDKGDKAGAQAIRDHIKSLSGLERDTSAAMTGAEQAPNFALRRRGQYMVSGTLAAGRTPDQVKRFQQILQSKGFHDVVIQPNADNNTVYIRTETKAQNENLKAAFLQAQKENLLDPKKNINHGLAASLYDHSGVLPSWLQSAIKNVRSKMPDLEEGADPKLVDAYETARGHALDSMVQQYMDALPESSMSKLFARREGVQGASGDMAGAFMDRAMSSSRGLANVATSDEFANITNGMRDEVQALKSDGNASSTDAIRAQQSFNELQLRNAQRGWKMAHTPFDNVRHITHMFELGFSVPYTITLMSQIPTLAWGELAKQHGYLGAAKSMAKFTPMAFKIMKAAFTGADKWHFALTAEKLAAAGVPKDIADFVLHQNNRGDFNLSSYTQWVYENQHGTIIPKGIVDASGASTLYAEMLPRLVTALAARDLYTQNPVKGATFNDLHTFVSDKVNRSQFSWNPDLNPRYTGKHGLLGQASPLVAQFTGYHFKLLEKLYRETADAFGQRGEDYAKQGRRFMGMHLAAMAALSGTMGLPMTGMFAGLYDRLADLITGDNTHDIRASYRDFLNTTFGKDVGEVLAHGVPRAAGIDLSHLGEDRIMLGTQAITEKRQWEDAEKDWLKSMAGSAFGLGSDIVLAGRDMYNGDYLQAASRGLPEMLRNAADAELIREHGFEDKSGFKLPISGSTSASLMKLLGFDTSQEAEYKEVKGTMSGLQARQQYDQQNIMRHLALAYNREDPQSYGEWLNASQQFMMNNPGVKPPAMGFADYLKQHARSAALAGALGTPLGVSPRNLMMRGMVSYGNIGGGQ